MSIIHELQYFARKLEEQAQRHARLQIQRNTVEADNTRHEAYHNGAKEAFQEASRMFRVLVWADEDRIVEP